MSTPQSSGNHGPFVPWPESLVMLEFEGETLPLLFAPLRDFQSYYDALLSRLPRRHLAINHMKALCMEAREAFEVGRWAAVIDKLKESAELRRTVFSPTDYQYLAARMHLAWTAVHLATLSLSDAPPAANSTIVDRQGEDGSALAGEETAVAAIGSSLAVSHRLFVKSEAIADAVAVELGLAAPFPWKEQKHLARSERVRRFARPDVTALQLQCVSRPESRECITSAAAATSARPTAQERFDGAPLRSSPSLVAQEIVERRRRIATLLASRVHFMLHFNWASYWARTGKFGVAAEHAQSASAILDIWGHHDVSGCTALSPAGTQLFAFNASRIAAAHAACMRESVTVACDPHLAARHAEITREYVQEASNALSSLSQSPSSAQDSESAIPNQRLISVSIDVSELHRPGPKPRRMEDAHLEATLSTLAGHDPNLTFQWIVASDDARFQVLAPEQLPLLSDVVRFVSDFADASVKSFRRKYDAAEGILRTLQGRCATAAGTAEGHHHPWKSIVDDAAKRNADARARDKCSQRALSSEQTRHSEGLAAAQLIRDAILVRRDKAIRMTAEKKLASSLGGVDMRPSVDGGQPRASSPDTTTAASAVIDGDAHQHHETTALKSSPPVRPSLTQQMPPKSEVSTVQPTLLRIPPTVNERKSLLVRASTPQIEKNHTSSVQDVGEEAQRPKSVMQGVMDLMEAAASGTSWRRRRRGELDTTGASSIALKLAPLGRPDAKSKALRQVTPFPDLLSPLELARQARQASRAVEAAVEVEAAAPQDARSLKLAQLPLSSTVAPAARSPDQQQQQPPLEESSAMNDTDRNDSSRERQLDGRAGSPPSSGGGGEGTNARAKLLASQRSLTALLPSLDPHSAAYRDVVRRMAENESKLRADREEAHRRDLRSKARAIAQRAKMSKAWATVEAVALQ